MMAKVDLVDAAWMGRSFASDPDLVPPPARPRLIRELVIVPIGDGLLFVGGAHSEVIRGKSARSLLPRVLPHLDGERTVPELAAACAVPETMMHDVVALLYSRGLLEEGAPSARRATPWRDLVSFLGRFTDVSRSNRHREQSLHRLEQAEVFVAGAGERAELLVSALERIAVGTVRAGVDPELVRTADLVVAFACDAADDPETAIAAAWHAGKPCLHIRVGAAGAHIGPLFRRGETSCYRCFRRLHGVPTGTPSNEQIGFWAGVATLHVLHYLTRLAKGSVHCGMRRYEVDERGELVAEALAAPAFPGCAACGIPGRALDPDDPAFLAWAYHSLIQFPGRDLLSPREHQNHYVLANVQLATIERHGFAGATRVELPPASVDGSVPWLAGPIAVTDRPFDRAALASILARTAGCIDDAGRRRRVAPTGGGLGSVELFAVVRDVAGLAPGVYYYDGAQHELERLRDVDDRDLVAALATDAVDSACVIVGTGSFARTQQKYGAFGYRLIYLDAGVAATYVHAIAASSGVATHELAEFDDRALAAAIGLPASNAVLPTFAIGIRRRERSSASRPVLSQLLPHSLVERCARPGHTRSAWPSYPTLRLGPEPALRELDRVLLARRAVRSYAERALDPRATTALVTLASGIHHYRIAIGGADVLVRPLAAIRIGSPELPAGLYEVDRPGQLRALRDGLTLDEMRDCVIQNSLAAAPLAIYFMADLEHAFARRGPRGYRDAAIHAGAMAAQVWLAATSFGLGACAAGGVAPGAVSRLTGIDGYHGCALFAIFVGDRPDIASPGDMA